jgi:hypothetical protein
MDTTHDPTPSSPDDAEEALADLTSAGPSEAPEPAERLAAHLTAALDEPVAEADNSAAGTDGSAP